ncbi:MAG TPA: hypothetical protein VF872_09450 [Gaiellaceae bacterium]
MTNRYRDLDGLLHRHAAPNITSPSTFNKRSIARGTTSVFTVTGSDFQSGMTAWIDGQRLHGELRHLRRLAIPG